MRACAATIVGVSVLSMCVGVPGQAFGADISREGVGARRDRLNEMELTMFDHTVFDHLSDWTSELPRKADLEGKVVLITTFASWNPNTHSVLKKSQRLNRRKGEDGLVVIGVHHPDRWENAPDVMEKAKVNFPCAHDAKGDFRRALMVDQDPDLYLIDRAGQLRFADIETDDLSEAVDLLLGETAEAAGEVPEQRRREQAERDRASRRTGVVGHDFKPGRQLDVPFEAPAEEAYEAVEWPRFGVKVEFDKATEEFYTDPPQISLPDDESVWVGDPLPSGKGRLLVIYAFDPKRTATRGIVPVMEEIQRKHQKDIEVVGITFNWSAGGFGESNEDRQKVIERNRKAVRKMLGYRSLNHRILLDDGAIDDDEFSDQDRGGGRTKVDDLSIAFIVSTDNHIRYIGHPGFDDFRSALKRLKDLDPGVLARREAEEAFLRDLSASRKR